MKSQRSRSRATAMLAGCALLAAAFVTGTAVPAAAATASNGPGVNAFWNEPHIQGFADALGASSKVWYEVGDGQLGNVMYPQVDNPDTFGLQYYVTDAGRRRGSRRWVPRSPTTRSPTPRTGSRWPTRRRRSGSRRTRRPAASTRSPRRTWPIPRARSCS